VLTPREFRVARLLTVRFKLVILPVVAFKLPLTVTAFAELPKLTLPMLVRLPDCRRPVMLPVLA
jgi:hypothetical protein